MPNGIKAPSHYTVRMLRYRLAQIMDKSYSRSWLNELMGPGRDLEAEFHENQWLIPTERVIQFLNTVIEKVKK